MFDLHDPVTCARLEEGSWSGANSTKRFREARGDTGTGGSTRVVIDILSGASAGGINAIFLAKALSTGSPMVTLKDLWVEEGDVAKLVNDDVSRPPS